LQLYERPARDTGLLWLLAGAAVIVGTAFAVREERWLLPDRGAGYALGVAGLGAMLALLLYSLRKRLHAARGWGPVRTWFRLHMFLGIAGPVAILLHCNFTLGAVNSRVALFCMLAVAASGVVGRLLYARIHAGLFGRRLSLMELQSQLESGRRELAGLHGELPASRALARFERAAGARAGLPSALVRLLDVSLGHRRALARAVGDLRRAGADPARVSAFAEDLAGYLEALRGVAAFAAYDRLFALWHAVHLPFCLLLFGAALAHVVAVHVY
jgi:hypothetical protein